MTDTESKTITPYRAEKQARVQSVGHLARHWAEYQENRTAIRAEAMRVVPIATTTSATVIPGRFSAD